MTLVKTRMHIHCSGPQGDRAKSQCNSSTWKMFLERPFISDAGHDSAHILFRSLGRQSF